MALIRDFLLAALFLAVTCNAQDPIVQLPNGQVRGTQQITDRNVPYYSFQKIPYAAPPVGDLRFRAPVQAPNWDGVLDATNLDVICYQSFSNDERQSEDCLYINVFTPQLPSPDNSVSLPVLAYVYGGGFTGGDATINNYGPDYLLNENIVVVSFNYRSGAFGYLSTQDDVIPGNYGLKDQHFALQWVHDNIALFGGDPNKVTIQGQSSGAASVTLHLLNPRNNGLINAVIAWSGSAVDMFSNQRDSRVLAFEIGRQIDPNFNSDNSNDLLQLLRQTDAPRLNSLGRNGATGFPFAPVIEVASDEAVITDKAYQLFRTGQFVRVPLFVGFDSEECIGLDSFANFPNDDQMVPPNIDALNIDSTTRNNILQQIQQYYTNGNGIKNDDAGRYRFCSDNLLIRGIIKLAELTAGYVPTYLFEYDFVGNFNNGNINLPGLDHVGHADELVYIWHHPGFPSYDSLPQADQNNHNRVVRLIANFVKQGNPTPEPMDILQNITWPTINSSDLPGDLIYLYIGQDLVISSNPKNEMYQFWKQIFDSLNIYDQLDSY